MQIIWEFNEIENKHSLYRGDNCIKTFCEILKECAKSITNSEKKKNVAVNKKRTKITPKQQNVTFLEKKNQNKFAKDNSHQKIRDLWHYTGKYRGSVRSICSLRFTVTNEIPVIFLNGSNYD